MPGKDAAYGIKFFELATTEQDLLISRGKGTMTDKNGHVAGVVKYLMSDYLFNGHTFFFFSYETIFIGLPGLEPNQQAETECTVTSIIQFKAQLITVLSASSLSPMRPQLRASV